MGCIRSLWIILLLLVSSGLPWLFACSATHETHQQPVARESTVPAIPSSLDRLAIFYPRSVNRSLSTAYTQLEAQTFLLKTQRPSLQIVDRSNLQALLDEQVLQLSGTVADDSITKVGHLLGADTLLFYRVEKPTLREEIWAAFSGKLPPVRVFSKVVRVDTGEVLFHHAVAVPVTNFTTDMAFHDIEPIVQTALEQGIVETIAALQRAFR